MFRYVDGSRGGSRVILLLKLIAAIKVRDDSPKVAK
jgi:hypothetical protein